MASMPARPHDHSEVLEPTGPSTVQDMLDEERATDEGMPDRVVQVPDPGHRGELDDEPSTERPDVEPRHEQ